jgi:hypothetical protein
LTDEWRLSPRLARRCRPGWILEQTFAIGSDGRAGDSTLCYSDDGPDDWMTGGVESNYVNW